MVAGFADDQVTWGVSGSSSVTFGIGLDSMDTGFDANVAASDLTVTMVAEQDAEKGAEDAVYGYIFLDNLKWAVSSSAAITTAPAVTAKIMAAPLSITISSVPAIASADKVVIQDSNDTATTTAFTANGGVAIGFDSDIVDVTVEFASETDYSAATTAAADNAYAVEVGASVALDPLSLAASFAMGINHTAGTDIGFAVKPSLSIPVAPLAIKPYVAFDGILGTAFSFEAGAGAEIDISEDGKTELLVDFSYAEAFGADIKVTATEGADDDGLIPDLSASVAVGVLDLGKTGATMGWSLDVTGAYQLMEDKVKPSVAFGLGSDEIVNLTVQLDLLKMIPNTDFTLKYTSATLAVPAGSTASLGTVTFKTTITY